MKELERVKLMKSTTEYNTHVEESTIGYEENRRLRSQLDSLHEEYNRIIDSRNYEYVQNFKQQPRKSGYGKKTVINQPSRVVQKESYV